MQFRLDFIGYFPEYISLCEKYSSGIYIVYAGINRDSACELTKIIYIGESDRICCEIKNHPQKNDWYNELSSGEELYFSIAQIDKEKRAEATAILIHQTKPLCNIKFTSRCPTDLLLSHVTCQGDNALLSDF